MEQTDQIYLDYNASCPISDTSREVMMASLSTFANPSSVHRLGQRARNKIEGVRKAAAQLLGIASDRIVWTSGATEANYLATTGTRSFTDHLIVSAVEHPSVLANAPDAFVAPVDANGVIDLAALDAILKKIAPQQARVCVQFANNETGVLQSIGEISAIVKRYDALWICDAVQGLGKSDLSDIINYADIITLSGHKIGAPRGVGAMIVNDDVKPVIFGGGQEKGLRAGTENLAAICAFGQAIGDVITNLSHYQQTMGALRDLLETRLGAIAGVQIAGAQAQRLDNTSLLISPDIDAHTLVMAFDLEGFAVSSGSACSSGKVGPSHVLDAMGYDAASAARGVRISLGVGTTKAQIEKFCAAFGKIVQART